MDRKNIEEPDIKNVQSLLFGDNNELITDVIRKDARSIVTDVVSEAMHDRQKQDNSLSKTIAPIMESAIAQSIEHNKASIVSSLYPVVGSLVRKSVSVFFDSFLEKLNYLIEYSLTIKGLKWRIAAWRAGIPFTQYIIKRSFVYRVEDVMLIHRPSGTLLCDVASEHSDCNDPALMSAMLSAINDFMTDSFNHSEDVVLDTIKTQNLTLIIASAPNALLVAAVSGIPPTELHSTLQLALEEIHGLMIKEIKSYDGDNAPFLVAQPYLKRCLLSEVNPHLTNKKTRYKAGIVIFLLILSTGYGLFDYWQKQGLIEQIITLPSEPGFHIQSAHWQNGAIQIQLLRDPSAISAKDWQARHQLTEKPINFDTLPYQSLDLKIITGKIEKMLGNLPLKYQLAESILTLTGTVDTPLTQELILRLLATSGVSSVNIEQVIIKPSLTSISGNHRAMLLKQYLGNLVTSPVSFSLKSANLTPRMQTRTADIASQIIRIQTLAEHLNLPVGIIISGYSDSLGDKAQNLQLSTHRANQVKDALVSYGVIGRDIFAVGVGEIPLEHVSSAARKVIITGVLLTDDTENTSMIHSSSTNSSSINSTLSDSKMTKKFTNTAASEAKSEPND